MNVHLHQVAPWNPNLRRTYREWFAEYSGRYFRTSATSLDGFWTTWEITADGTDLQLIAVYAPNLTAVRQAITDVVSGMDLQEVAFRALSAPKTPTGRNQKGVA